MMGVSENIKRVRKEKGITQKELAEKLGITQAAVSHFELSDKDSPVLKLRLSTLEKLAEALDVELTDLIGEPQYDSGYNEGFAKGEESMQEKANKIVEFWKETDWEETEELFGRSVIYGSVFKNINESYNKIMEYEKKKKQEEKEIEVGDEVENENGNKYIVIEIDKAGREARMIDRQTMCIIGIKHLTKTGKHYPIDEMLKELE